MSSDKDNRNGFGLESYKTHRAVKLYLKGIGNLNDTFQLSSIDLSRVFAEQSNLFSLNLINGTYKKAFKVLSSVSRFKKTWNS